MFQIYFNLSYRIMHFRQARKYRFNTLYIRTHIKILHTIPGPQSTKVVKYIVLHLFENIFYNILFISKIITLFAQKNRLNKPRPP